MLFRNLRAADASARGSRRRRSAPTPCARRGFLKVEPPVRLRSGCDSSRACGDAVHLGLDRGRARPARRGRSARDDDRAVGQFAVAIGVAELVGRPASSTSPERSTTSHSTRMSHDLAAIGAAVHAHEAADRAGDRAQEFEPGDARRRARVEETRMPLAPPPHLQRHLVEPLDLGERPCRAARRRPARRRRGRSCSSRGRAPSPARAGSSSRRKATRSSTSAGSNSHLGRAARLEPDQRRQRRVGLELAAHIAARDARVLIFAARALAIPSARPAAHLVMSPAPMQTIMSPSAARSRRLPARSAALSTGLDHAVAVGAQPSASAAASTPSIGSSPAA